MKTKKRSFANDTIRNPAKFLFNFSGWEKMTGREFNTFRNKAHSFYYNETKDADLQIEVHNWMKSNKYSKRDMAAIKKVTLHTTIGILCKLLRSGCPDFNEKHNDYIESLPGPKHPLKPISSYIKSAIREAIEAVAPVVEAAAKKPTNVISISERIDQQISGVIGELEGLIDDIHDKKITLKEFDPYKILVGSEIQIKPAHAKRIAAAFEPAIAECKEILLWEDPYIIESYAYLDSVRKRVEYSKLYTSIVEACKLISEAGKLTRKARKPKFVSAEHKVSKMQYMPQDVQLKQTSVNPSKIIGATEVWIFNTKTRKLGKYVADPLIKTLSVKGTSILNFDPVQSDQKLLRKPEEQLALFQKAGKVELRKFLGNIKGKSTALTGRMSKDILILKVI